MLTLEDKESKTTILIIHLTESSSSLKAKFWGWAEESEKETLHNYTPVMKGRKYIA